MVSAAIAAALFLLVLLLIEGWRLTPIGAAIVVTVMPLAAILGSRLGPLVPSAKARAAAGAILVSGGLGGLALLPKAEVALTLPPQILVGIGLALVLSALTETALGGRAPQAIHGGWTISARHAGVVIGLLALTPIFTADIAEQRDDAIDAGTAVILDSRGQPAARSSTWRSGSSDRLEGEKGKVPTIGPAFEPLPERSRGAGRSRRAARRTAGPARPRRHPRLQPLVPARRPARPAGADPDRPLAAGGAVNAGAAGADAGRRRRSSLPGAGRRLPGGRRLLLHAGEESRTPASTRAWTRSRRASARSPTSSRSRPSTAPPASSASRGRTLARALATPEARERFGERYGIDDAELARAIRAGLLRAVDDAEEAGALSPFIAGPLRATVEEIPLDQAIELINDARLAASATSQAFLGPAGDLLEELLP